MTLTTFAIAVCLAIGLAGIVVPILPGTVLMLVALLVWALEVQTRLAWGAFAVAALILLLGQVLKYLIPGKQLKATVPNSTLLIGGLTAVVGFFVVPVVGALAGFPLGVYLAEYHRLGRQAAWPSTKQALKAVGVSIFIEFTAGVAASATWLAAVLAA